MAVASIVGAGQVIQRPGSVELDSARGPVELMAEAALLAAQDAGAPSLLGRIDWIGVAGGWFRYRNPGQLLAQLLGSPWARTALSSVSGTGPQEMVAFAAERIAKGEMGVALVVGGEARWSHQRLKRAGRDPSWNTDPGEGDPQSFGGFPAEMIAEAAVIGPPIHAYALIEDSLRNELGESIDVHRRRIAELWSRFSTVAAGNPWAWHPSALGPDEILMESADNRMLAFPYTKAMVANNTVDMASCVLVCDQETARSAGVGRDRMVFPIVVASAHDTWRLANRDHLHRCPALEASGRAAFGHAGIGPDAISHVDLYACFPSIVEISAAALGFPLDAPLTLTGGLGFAGAPVGNSVGHSIAALVGALRGGGYGLIHANGGNATKHSVGIYSDRPAGAFEHLDVQDRVASGGRLEMPSDFDGGVHVEAATVIYDRDGPSQVLAAVLDQEARRGWARSDSASLIEATLDTGIAGQVAIRTAEGTLDV